MNEDAISSVNVQLAQENCNLRNALLHTDWNQVQCAWKGAKAMRLTLLKNGCCTEPAVTVEYSERTHQVDRIIGFVEYLNQSEDGLVVSADGEIYILDPSEILYVESVDRKTFCYTSQHIYETARKLYEIAESYAAADLMRISKNCIINLQRIRSIRPDFGARILATMDNGEKVFVSRQYAAAFKEKLGLGGR